MYISNVLAQSLYVITVPVSKPEVLNYNLKRSG